MVGEKQLWGEKYQCFHAEILVRCQKCLSVDIAIVPSYVAPHDSFARSTPLSGADLNGADLNGADLNGANLSGADLNGADLNGADLSRANLNGADLSRADLRKTKLRGVKLSRTKLSGAKLNGADLSRVNLNAADLNGANLSRANLSRANLNGADLRKTKLNGADLNGADLNGADLNGADLRKTKLNGADLNGADLNGANLSRLDLSRLDLSGTKLNEANLSEANLSGLDLSGLDLSGVNLSGANLSGANLSGANLNETNLSGANLSRANLSGANLNKANLSRANLSGANLSRANLSEANLSGLDLSGLDLSGLDLSGANLSGANLSKTQALGTNFTNARFTGACLEYWNINSATKLDNTDCQFIYLKSDEQERRPSSGEFAPGEFTKLFQKALETVDLIFADGIDWKAFFQSFEELRRQYNDEDLSIQAIEKKSGGAFVIRLEVSAEANKVAIESHAKELYKTKLLFLEKQYQLELQGKQELIFKLECDLKHERQTNTNLLGVVKTMAEKEPTHKTTIHATNVGFVQSGSGTVSNFSQSIGQNIDEISKIISSLRDMAQEFPEAQREEALVHLDDLEEDINKPEKRKPERIKTRIVALLTIAGTIASVIAGATDFSNNVLDLADKLNIPIEFSQSQHSTQQLPPSILNQSSKHLNP
ncbi:pentapeptide repeat-containing protein [Nostoc punctiforme FACHB-252]|uniref:Pentapeptide repeat-containing protein n=1 Tax=Nostoc punctiforme FACHB-252 TaxID=1357509 RepID=A0ABR8HKD9_NOSPU|nr:pentapeptide repeat-containing protein [Nostoc punctiforme]MBD2616320.1 pentapeptide repeat-containing protein [Nostoc punctiforme FACHB-252]